jgi:hypothetical protein
MHSLAKLRAQMCTVDCGNPLRLDHLALTVPLFVTSYIFDARISRCKTDTYMAHAQMISVDRPSHDTIPFITVKGTQCKL